MVIRVKKRLRSARLCWVWLAATMVAGQTFQIGGNAGSGNASSHPQQNSGAAAGQQAGAGTGLSWGSSIQVARQARAANDALQKGDYAAATAYAEQAAKAAPQEYELWYTLGYAARLAGRYPLSLSAYQSGMEHAPPSAQAQGMTGMAETYVKMGRDNEARQILMKVVAANPQNTDALQQVGELFLKLDPQKAVDLLIRADTLKPVARTEVLIAGAYQRLNQPDQAKQYLERAKNRAPHNPEVVRAVAGQYRDAGQYDLAIATLRTLPLNAPDVIAELAYTYQLAGQREQAAQLYSQAARQAGGNIGFALSAAQALVDVGQTDGARAFLDQVQQREPDNYRLHEIRGRIDQSEDRYPEAVQDYKAALSNLPPAVPEGPLYPLQLRLNLYELYRQTDNASAAKQEIEQAAAQIAAVQPSTQARPEYLRLRAAIKMASGDLKGADQDLQQAMALAPNDINSISNYADLMWQMGQKETARKLYQRALAVNPRNRQALLSLGHLARDMGKPKEAESYFTRAVRLDPKSYAAYLALGDLYTSSQDYAAAETNYEAAFQRMPSNPATVAGGANAALLAHRLPLAEQWLSRATGAIGDNPQVMRERERYLTLTGDYAQSARLGFQVIQHLPRDPQAPIYLAYDLYYLGRYQEVSDLVARYTPIFPRDKDLALISGYLHVRDNEYPDALADFSRALEADSRMPTGYVARGYVLNHLRRPTEAAHDFQTALQLSPNDGEAHMGLAYSDLQLRRSQQALDQLAMAEKLLGHTHEWQTGRSHEWHLGRAEAFRQQQKLKPAIAEYRAALKEKPADLETQMALADTQYLLRQYEDALDSFQAALKLSPANPEIYARMAQVHAHLKQPEATLRAVQAAEQAGGTRADILMRTGDALLTLGEQDAAMQRFSRALEEPGADRVGIRLAIAEVFVRQGRRDDALRQISLSLAESRIGEAPPPTADNFVQAANLLLGLNEFSLGRSYFEKARQAGASPRVVAIGLANSYLAEGNTQAAHRELASLGDSSQYRDDYDYTMAWANLYRERQETVHALSRFAQASTLAPHEDPISMRDTQYELAGEEGRQINQQLSVFSDASLQTLLEDINVYSLDAKMLGVTNPALLPKPRHSLQSLGEEHYRVHLPNVPTIVGFVGESRASGIFSFPSTGVIQDRTTYDTMFNSGILHSVHLGSNTITFNPGIQFTLRRDTTSPLDMNQNLFSQYLYLSTSSFYNWVSVHGAATRETGPFTEQNLNSRDLSANIEFTVGRPWGHTALLSGYSVRDLLFKPAPDREYYTTSQYLGLQHTFGKRLTIAGLAEYLRSWEVFGSQYAIAQAVRPRVRFEYRTQGRWQVEGSFGLSRGEGFHPYDNVESEFLVSYLRPVPRKVTDTTGQTTVDYPSRFSFGVQEQTFYNFNGAGTTMVLPVLHFTLF